MTRPLSLTALRLIIPSILMDPDLPPTYAALASPASPVPLYSERPSIAERVLITEPHSTRLAPAAQGQRHVYKTDYLEVRLHPPHWGLTLPAYGFAGTVDGLIAFRKSCSHVTEVSVSVSTLSPRYYWGDRRPDIHLVTPRIYPKNGGCECFL